MEACATSKARSKERRWTICTNRLTCCAAQARLQKNMNSTHCLAVRWDFNDVICQKDDSRRRSTAARRKNSVSLKWVHVSLIILPCRGKGAPADQPCYKMKCHQGSEGLGRSISRMHTVQPRTLYHVSRYLFSWDAKSHGYILNVQENLKIMRHYL